jgi:hypothetical protein
MFLILNNDKLTLAEVFLQRQKVIVIYHVKKFVKEKENKLAF